MFKAKYQAHRIVNIIFYIIVFFIGFYMGVMGQKVGIKSLFDKFLMIDTVYAETDITSNFDTDFLPTSNNWYDESLIINIFNQVNLIGQLDLNISSYLNVYATFTASPNNQYTYIFSTSVYTGSSNQVYTTGSHIRVDFRYNSNNSTVAYTFDSNSNHTSKQVFNSGISYQLAATNSPSHTINYPLDFSIYHSFNENLFSNNNDFKQVCVNPKNAFAISYTELYQNKNSFGDYIWFPYNIIYLNYGRYNTLNSKMIFDEPTTDKHIFFNSSEKFDLFDTVNGLQLVDGFNATITSSYPYNTRYNYYGWSAYPFAIADANSDSPHIPVYKFSTDFMTVQLSSFGIAHGGGTRTHHDLTDENNQNLSMCFYINKFYTVTELTENGTGNYEGTIPTPNGDINLYSVTGGDFFGSFHEEDFGLTAIVTAPLNAIRQISNGTCTPQTITILGKSITLPCGDTIFWGREDLQDFKLFWNMFFGGILCYGIGLSLYRKIHKFTNPLDDRVEVIDL